MNHAEEAVPCRSAEGNNQGASQGGQMFDRISLIKIAYAYSLFYDETFELAKRLTAYLKVGGGCILADRVNDLAEYWVEKSTDCEEETEMIAATASEFYRILIPEHQRDLMRTNCKDKAIYVMRCFILGGMTVNKREAVQFLHSNGYAQKEEIKGLSDGFIDRIERDRSYLCARDIEITLGKILSKILSPAHLAPQGNLSATCSSSDGLSAQQPIPISLGGVPDDVKHEYENAAASEIQKGKRSGLLVALYYAQGCSLEEIAQEFDINPDRANIRRKVRCGLTFAQELRLPDLTPYLENIGRKGLSNDKD